METLITVVHVMTCLLLILIVLLQAGRGGGLGAGLSGANTQMFGGKGAAPLLVKVTSGLAAIFFITSLTLSGMSSERRSVVLNSKGSTITEEDSGNSAQEEAPAATAEPTDPEIENKLDADTDNMADAPEPSADP